MKSSTAILTGIIAAFVLLVFRSYSPAHPGHGESVTPRWQPDTPEYVILRDIGKTYEAMAQEQTELLFAEHARLRAAAYGTAADTLEQAMSHMQTLEQLMIDISATHTSGAKTPSPELSQRIRALIGNIDQLLKTGEGMETAITALSSFETTHRCGVPNPNSTLYTPTCSDDLQKPTEEIRAVLTALEAMKSHLSRKVSTQ